MKYLIILLAGVLCHCTPNWAPESPDKQNENILIRVECRRDPQLETHVKQVLRLVRYNDLEKTDDGITLVIKARYSKLPRDKALQIIDDLKHISGVLDVMIIRDGVPVKNAN